MEKNFCTKCGKCCERIAVDFEKRIVYRDGVQPLNITFEKLLIPIDRKENITFCKCKYLIDHLCMNDRKPEECTNYPSSPFAFLPDNCGYYGEIFLKKENIMQKIRKMKEELLDYESQLIYDKNMIKLIKHHETAINKYKIYGSENW